VLTIVHVVVLLALAVLGWILTKQQFVKRMGQ
jgi:lipooligosaccharide transport system permease protein